MIIVVKKIHDEKKCAQNNFLPVPQHVEQMQTERHKEDRQDNMLQDLYMHQFSGNHIL